MSSIGNTFQIKESSKAITPSHEVHYAFLTQQNKHLQKELSFTKYTINALKSITAQKESALQNTKKKLEQAHFRIRILEMTLARQQDHFIQQSIPKVTQAGTELDEATHISHNIIMENGVNRVQSHA
ncbi:hypothetical protein K501DRAFT_58692 [Backusella circina FSU 941]|nr:hypothetical protein K501DRAFT_58692 [Backusella circina FSU 941]